MVKNILIRNLTVDDNRMLQEIKRETGLKSLVKNGARLSPPP